MRRRGRLFLAVLAGLTAMAMGCGRVSSRSAGFAASSAPTDWADARVAGMTLREKAGQMVWPTVLGTYSAANSRDWAQLRQWIAEDKVGGFTVSVGSPVEIAVKLNGMQALSALPLLFAADFEFGAGYRARGGHFMPNNIDLGGAVVFPPQMALGATGDTALAYEQGRVTAIEGRALGVHIAYAPILDVNNNPNNPVINTRSYGEDPLLVGRLGAAFIRGVQDHGMLATAKHFPGHGDTEVNSHLALPSIGASRARLDSLELVPFRAAVDAGAQAFMSFHGAIPSLDASGAPGTLSRSVLTDLLRGEMRFKGMVFSDAMDMRGVLNTYGAVEATIRTVEAGADILIQPVDVKQTIDAIVSGVQSGRYDEARLDRSARAILRLKQRLGLHRGRFVDADSIRLVVGDSNHAASARRIAERSITLVKDSFDMVPLRQLAPATRILSVSFANRNDIAAGGAFNTELRRHFRELRTEFAVADGVDLEAAFGRALAASDSVDVVVVGSYVSHAWNVASIAAPHAFAGFLDRLAARGKRPILVALGNPYLLQQTPSAAAYLVAWGGFPVSQVAAARALVGAIPIQGVLPVSIPPSWRAGTGLRRSGH